MQEILYGYLTFINLVSRLFTDLILFRSRITPIQHPAYVLATAFELLIHHFQS